MVTSSRLRPATTDAAAADRFLAAVNSAGVYLNCSTRFEIASTTAIYFNTICIYSL